MVFFGGLTVFAALAVYAFTIVGIAAVAMEVDSGVVRVSLVLLGVLLALTVVYTMGQGMILFGDKMRGRYAFADHVVLLKMLAWTALRDYLVGMAGFCAVSMIGCLLSAKAAAFIVLCLVSVLVFVAASRTNERIAKLVTAVKWPR